MKIRGKHQASRNILQEVPSYRNNKLNLYSTQHLDGIIKFCSLLGIEEKIIIWTGWYNWIIYEGAFLLYTRCSFQYKADLKRSTL